jgi:hypothetical protein
MFIPTRFDKSVSPSGSLKKKLYFAKLPKFLKLKLLKLEVHKTIRSKYILVIADIAASHTLYCNNVCPYVRRLWNNLLTYGGTEQHTILTYQTSNTQFIDAPEDGPVGQKHVELSNILWINIQP